MSIWNAFTDAFKRFADPNVDPAMRAPSFEPLPWKFRANDVKEAAKLIIPYLQDTSEPNQIIYFDGWTGLGASTVLKALAEDHPPSLRNSFNIIIDIDCSRWKNRRALQRIIADKVRLPQHVMAVFDRQDEDDDFSGVDESSRLEITDVGREIHQALQGQRCLVVFHNGSNNFVDLNDFGIPQSDRWSTGVQKTLWTFRGRLRAIPGMKQAIDQTHASPSSESINSGYGTPTPKNKVDNSHIYLYSYTYDSEIATWNELIREEAAEIARYTHKPGVTLDLAALCCKYLLLLNSKGGDTLDFNWATHASNYWVCDGIIQECQQNNAWEMATALHEEMSLKYFSSYDRLPNFGDKARWIVATNSDNEEIKPETTSFFWANKGGRIASLPNNIFQRSEQLHVLKLCLCTFSFSSPPFLHCRNIRFLGLNNCMDRPQELKGYKREDDNDMRKFEFFRSLWVLDICSTDWELDMNISEIVAVNIREISIKRGRIWHENHAWTWRYLQNIHKLRVIEPTCPWETSNMDEFRGMVKLELLDLSGNRTMQILPRGLSGATGLRTLVLDGCIGLEQVSPDALPPLVETFSFDAGAGKDHEKEAKISFISMAGCARLVKFRLRGSLPNLEHLDLSNTSVKTLDLKDKTVQVPHLQRVILLACERLHAILWPKNGMPNIMLLRIDTRGGTETARSKAPHDPLASKELEEYGRASVSVTDMRFLQSLVLESANKFCWNTAKFNLNIILSSTSKADAHSDKEEISIYSARLVGSPQHKSSVPKMCSIYGDVSLFVEKTVDNGGSSTWQFQPLDLHVEIGEGLDNSNVVTKQGISSVIFLMNRAKSLLVHDNSFITNIIPGSMMFIAWSSLKYCHIEKCSKLETVFATTYHIYCFCQLETFSAADLLMARCIWSKGRVLSFVDHQSFAKLQGIYLRLCPRLTFVLPLSWNNTLSSLETLHIVYCGALSQVFPVEAEFLSKISTGHPGGVLEFPKLKHIYLHELPKLHQICEAKMFTPELKTIWVRGCWSLQRLPATADRPDCRPVVNCEEDWWGKLEWDGKQARHHPSLFEPRHSKYYKKKNLLRGTVLR